MPVKPRTLLFTRGFTLIELLVSIVVLAIAMTSLGVWMLNANAASADPIISMRAATLGQAYLEEVLSKRFDENTAPGGNPRCNEMSQPACSGAMGPEGEARALFDDVDDYHGIVDTPPLDIFGNPRASYDGYQVAITVNYAGGDFGLPNQDLKRIEVTVTSPAPASSAFAFSAYRGNF